MKKKILIIAAHPDDEILGCGGTVARLIREGCTAYTLILGEGITSRDRTRNAQKRKRAITTLKREAQEANRTLGIKKVFFYDFPDNRFDAVPFLDIVKAIEEVKDDVKPDIVFTHYENDLNIDHRIAYRAALTATRPLQGERARELYSFEIPSSTEWYYPLAFIPDVFFDISRTDKTKLKALKKYKNELRKAPHPRSLEGVQVTARLWGMKTGLDYAEAFKTVRVIK